MEYSKVIASVILAYIVNFLMPIVPFLAMLVVLVFADLYTGVKAAKKRGSYDPKKASEGWRNTVNKISQYFIAILLSEGMVLAFEIPTAYLPLTYIVALYIAMVEFKSNIENISETTGVSLWDAIKEKVDNILHLRMQQLQTKEVETSEVTTDNEDIKEAQ